MKSKKKAVFVIVLITLLLAGWLLVMLADMLRQDSEKEENKTGNREKTKMQHTQDTLQEKTDVADLYKGKWKITDIIELDFNPRADCFPQHYLGRTVIIGDECIETSIWHWPFELDWNTEEYDRSEMIFMNCNNPWVKSNTNWDTMYRTWGEESMPFLRFYYADKEWPIDYFIILDEGHLAYDWPGGYYLLEPFSWCNPDMDTEGVWGEWNVVFLDSYDETYEGGWKEIEETRLIYGDKIDELRGSDFYAQEWLGKTIIISKNKLALDSDILEVASIREETVNRENFEQEWGIHDGLSIYDDMIKAVFVECTDGSSVPIILVDNQKIIIHIEQGWFMLEKL